MLRYTWFLGSCVAKCLLDGDGPRHERLGLVEAIEQPV